MLTYPELQVFTHLLFNKYGKLLPLLQEVQYVEL